MVNRRKNWKVSGARESARLLFVHLAVGAAVVLCSLLFFALDLHFPPCAFNRLTGFYCMTCGATRAVYALLHLQFFRSLLLNPLPVLLAGFWLSVVLVELFRVRTGKRISFRWCFPVFYTILGLVLLHCLLRNFGIVPIPDMLF